MSEIVDQYSGNREYKKRKGYGEISEVTEFGIEKPSES